MKLSIDNLMFDELKKGFDDHLISLVKILTRGPVRSGEITLKLAVEIDVSTDYKDGLAVDVITPDFKWTITSKTKAQKFEHKGSTSGDYQLEIDINGINVEKMAPEEDEQMNLFNEEGEGTEIIVEGHDQTDEETEEGKIEEAPALPLDEAKTPHPWDDNEETYICQDCGFETAEKMTKCPKCEGEMISTELPLDDPEQAETESNEDSKIAI